jgi:hypothetical protein
MKLSSILFLGSALVVMLSGCGGGGGGSSSGGGDADVTMTVSSLSPADGATDVAIDTTLVATLSQTIDCAALPSDPLVLQDDAMSSVSGSISCSGTSLSFIPAAPLAYNTTYSATLKAGISEAAGAALASPASWSFTTAADTTAPQVESITPADSATDIALTTTLTATFDETLDCGTVTGSSFTLSDGGGGAVAGSVSCSGSGASFTPAADLTYSTTYTATLTTAISDSAGNTLATAYSWGFTTVADTTAPTVSSVTPADGSTDMAHNTNVTATFDEDIFAATVDDTSFILAANSGASGTVSFDGASNIATFTPDSDLALMATYTATLTTGITDLAGNALTSDFSWSFTTVDGSWGTAGLVEEENDGHAISPSIAFDGSGNAMAVWQQSDGTRFNIWARRYVAGSGWGTATLIESDNTDSAEGPEVAVDGSGNAIAVWLQSDGTRYNIWANRYVAGSGWGTAALIETENSGSATYPKVAVDNSGNAIAVWQQSDGSRDNIWANLYSAGGSWGTAELIETDNTAAATTPQVAFDDSGNAIAVWQQSDGTRFNIWANRYQAGGSWGTAELIETDDVDQATRPRISFDGSGNAVAVWQQSDGTRTNILANRYDVAGGAWGIAEQIESETGNANSPRISFDGSGNALAVWSQYDSASSSYNMWANRYDAGGSWGTAELIESNGGTVYTDAGGPELVVDDNGNALAVWIHQNGAVYSLWSNRYVGGSGWGTAQLLENDDTGNAQFPDIAIDDRGKAITLWYQHDGTRYNIQANRFE